jgi:hypothetical protein
MTDTNTTTCEWIDLLTGKSVCEAPATYRARYAGCPTCTGATCTGAVVCVDHAVNVRRSADVDGLLELRLLTGVAAP